MRLALLSNIFLILPVVFAFAYESWLYLFLASGIALFSPLYHWYEGVRPDSVQFRWFRKIDVVFARAAFVYMYYYAIRFAPPPYHLIMVLLLTAVVFFFWYAQGARRDKLHPWFHVVAPIVSSAILIVAHGL